MMIEYKSFRSSSYTIFPYVTWSNFMMIAAVKRDWHISFTVWILQNKRFLKLCPFSWTEFVTQCCSSASAGCVCLTDDFYKRRSKPFSSKIVILITFVAVIPFISQSVESWLSSGSWSIMHLVGGGTFCDNTAGNYNVGKVINLTELFACTTRMICK